MLVVNFELLNNMNSSSLNRYLVNKYHCINKLYVKEGKINTLHVTCDFYMEPKSLILNPALQNRWG